MSMGFKKDGIDTNMSKVGGQNLTLQQMDPGELANFEDGTNETDPPATYLECIDKIERSFLDLGPNIRKSNAFYTSYIQQLLQQNHDLADNLLEVQQEHERLIAQISELRNLYRENHAVVQAEEGDHKKKRKRRKAKEIKRLYTCELRSCRKNYGSQGALSHHMKIKHPEVPLSMLKQTLVGQLYSHNQPQLSGSQSSSPDDYSKNQVSPDVLGVEI